MNVGERIKERRIRCGLSADQVAEALGKNRATVYRYESNDIENLPTTILEPLAKILKTSPAYLMGWTNDPYDYSQDVEKRIASIPTHIKNELEKEFPEDLEKQWKKYFDMVSDAISNGAGTSQEHKVVYPPNIDQVLAEMETKWGKEFREKEDKDFQAFVSKYMFLFHQTESGYLIQWRRGQFLDGTEDVEEIEIINEQYKNIKYDIGKYTEFTMKKLFESAGQRANDTPSPGAQGGEDNLSAGRTG